MTESPTLGRARRAARALARSEGLSLQQALDRVAGDAGHAHWSAMLHADARKATDPTNDATDRAVPTPSGATPPDVVAWMRHRSPRMGVNARLSELKNLAMAPRLAAQAVDHFGGPWDDDDVLRCRCPAHDDRNPSLLLTGRGPDFRAACMAGCSEHDVTKAIARGIAEAARKSLAFKDANDRAGVYAGAANGQGGMGGCYTLDSEERFNLDTLTCRLLPEGYPRWNHG